MHPVHHLTGLRNLIRLEGTFAVEHLRADINATPRTSKRGKVIGADFLPCAQASFQQTLFAEQFVSLSDSHQRAQHLVDLPVRDEFKVKPSGSLANQIHSRGIINLGNAPLDELLALGRRTHLVQVAERID